MYGGVATCARWLRAKSISHSVFSVQRTMVFHVFIVMEYATLDGLTKNDWFYWYEQLSLSHWTVEPTVRWLDRTVSTHHSHKINFYYLFVHTNQTACYIQHTDVVFAHWIVEIISSAQTERREKKIKRKFYTGINIRFATFVIIYALYILCMEKPVLRLISGQACQLSS